MDRKSVLIKKILRNFFLALIPNKEKRRNFRKKLIEKDLKREINYLFSTKGQEEFEILKKTFPKVMTTEETILEILKNKCSLVRFGDGEINMVLSERKSKVPYQKSNIKLEKRLREILKSGKQNILVCIPTFSYEGKENYKLLKEKEPPKFWERYWLSHKKVYNMFNLKYVYGNAFVSRAHSFYDGNFEKVKQLWDKREVVFVYGKKGRFQIDERLFKNIKSSEEIHIPPMDAFDSYEEILKECLKKPKDKLFLIAAGPTATVLAFDLANEGYQALDIGHLPNSYHEFLGEIEKPESLPKTFK